MLTEGPGGSRGGASTIRTNQWKKPTREEMDESHPWLVMLHRDGKLPSNSIIYVLNRTKTTFLLHTYKY